MGVIDLDARVKKLEETSAGAVDPATVAQLESDVSDLEDAVVSTVKGTITLGEGFTADDAAGGCYIVQNGNMVTLHLACHGLATSGLNTIVTTLPAEYRPDAVVTALATNSDLDTPGILYVSTDGKIYVRIASTVLRASVTYPINEVTPS